MSVYLERRKAAKERRERYRVYLRNLRQRRRQRERRYFEKLAEAHEDRLERQRIEDERRAQPERHARMLKAAASAGLKYAAAMNHR